jgi:hypothetical protein
VTVSGAHSLVEAYDGSLWEMIRVASKEVRVLLLYGIPALQPGTQFSGAMLELKVMTLETADAVMATISGTPLLSHVCA